MSTPGLTCRTSIPKRISVLKGNIHDTLSPRQLHFHLAPVDGHIRLQTLRKDDIYHVTNFTQGNVIPSAPIPAGPGNTDPNYTPLWQLSLVTWKASPHILKSEEEVLNAQSQGLVEIVKTNIVLNCPVIYTPEGGLLPTAKIIGDYQNQQQ